MFAGMTVDAAAERAERVVAPRSRRQSTAMTATAPPRRRRRMGTIAASVPSATAGSSNAAPLTQPGRL